MKNVPIDAKVQCTDGSCGKVTNVILNPVNLKLTHFALEEKSLPQNPTRLLPVSTIAETTEKQVTLKISKAEVAADMPAFLVTHFVAESEVGSAYRSGEVYYHDYVVSDFEAGSPYSANPRRRKHTDYMVADTAVEGVTEQAIPEGELELHSGMEIHATDGEMGKLNTLVLDPETGAVTHLMMREGHLWGKKDIAIPVDAVDYTDSKAVHVNLDKDAVHALPAVPVK